MKTLRWLLLSIFCLTFAMLKAEDQVKMTINAVSSDTVWNLDVAFENAASGNYTAFQMDLKLPKGFTYVENSFKADFRLLGHTCSAHMGADGLLHIIAYSARNVEIPGKTGKLFSLSLRAEAGIPSGQYSVVPQNVRFAKRDGNEFVIPANNVDFVYKEPVVVKDYVIVYNVDGKEYKRHTVTQGKEIPAIDQPVKEGHTFAGWKNLPQLMPDHDLVVEAMFTVNKYQLVAIVDGKEYAKVEYEYGAFIVLPGAPVKEGHTFSGWSEAPETMPAHDVEITGAFTYYIDYYLNGEFYGRQEVKYGEVIVPLEVENTGDEKFLGWEGLPQTMPAEDLKINGKTELTGIEELTAESKVDVYSLTGKWLLTKVNWRTVPQRLPSGLYIVNGYRVWIK